MTSLQHLQRIVLLFGLAFMLGAAGQLEAQGAVTAQVAQSGTGWRLLEAVADGSTSPGVPMWEVSEGGIAGLPVSQAQKDILLQAFADDPSGGGSNDLFYVSQEILAAMEDPNFPAGYEQYIEADAVSQGFSIGCEWETETRNRSWSYTENLLSQSLPFSSPFQGQLSLNIPITGQVTVAATYKIRECFGVPVGFKFVGASGNGTASITGDGDLDVSASTSALFEREWKLTEPELGSVSFSVGVIPVRLVFTLPIYAGVRLEAAISGQVEAHLDATAAGTFTFNCTTDTCTGSSNFTDQFEFTGAQGSVTVDLDAQAHARPMLRVGLYSPDFAYVEGGLKAYAKASIWGYYGNACGDADGNGVNENVQALAADLSWGYKFAYGLGGWILPDELSYTGGNEYLLGWRDLLGTGGSTALAPMIQGANSVVQGTQATYTIKMRPCYPYTNAVTFTMAPGTWTGTTTLTPPAGTATVQRSFSSTGNQTLVATAITDGFGRNLQTSASRVISVTPSIPAVPTSLGATATSATTVQLTWADNSNNETQFKIERRPYLTGSFVHVGSAAANATSYVDTTALPATSYEYRVRASNSAGDSNPSNTASVTTPAQGPVAPSSLTATALSATSVRLNWIDNSNNETQFLIERRTASGTFTQIAALGANVITYTDNTVQPATYYEYRVRAANGAGTSLYAGPAPVTTPNVVPAAPSSLTATALSATSVRLNWVDNSNNETQFLVERRIPPAAFGQIAALGANVITYTDNAAQPQTYYEYRVRASNATGPSLYSNTAAVTTSPVTPAAPSGLTATFNTTTRRIVLNWIDNSNNETGFTVQFSYSGSAFSDMGSTGANVTTYSSGSNPPTGGPYQFRVRAYNGLTSTWSNTASLIVPAPPTPTTSIAWIQPAESSWGPAGTLTAAGYAANGTGTVQLVWRERSSTGVWGPWTTVAYQASPSPDTTWSNTISSGNPTNKCHWFEAYTNYSGVSSVIFRYTGAPGCP